MNRLIDLQNLVRKYLDGSVGYSAFHSEFLLSFLSVHHDQQPIEDAVNAVESACGDFEEGDISVEELMDDLSTIANSPIFRVVVVGNGGLSHRLLALSDSPVSDSGSEAVWQFQVA